MKMLLILSAALFPLGLIAVFASIESAKTARLRRTEDVRQLASDAARQLSLGIGRSSLDLRAAAARLDDAPMSTTELAARCDRAVRELADGSRVPTRYAIFMKDGRRICSSDGFSPDATAAPDQLFATQVRLIPAAGLIRFEAPSPMGMLYGVGEMPTASVARLIPPPTVRMHHGIVLRQGDAKIVMATLDEPIRIGSVLRVASPVAGGQIMLELTANALSISVIEVLLALLPVLMWLAAALIGWLVVDRLLIRPLLQLQHAVQAYRPDISAPLAIPHMTTPAREIRGLGDAFLALTERIGQHDVEMEAGLARQMRLTREVHHRVKNNLQVVASLINIHSRGVDEPAVAAAYASIQRRVDALAVVHRNHYAELEANRGVGLRPLIGELAANLRATASPAAATMAIRLDIMPAFTTQDVAVPIAFLVTEIAEVAMLCDPAKPMTILLEPTERPDRARLVIAAGGLAQDDACADARSERFTRVVEGLSRQLRSKMALDRALGRYEIEIAIHPEDAPPASE